MLPVLTSCLAAILAASCLAAILAAVLPLFACNGATA